MIPKRVKIVEVGPRDGLQNEKTPLSVAQKVTLIQGLSQAGLKHIEVGSFVSPKWVPQMANTDEVIAALTPSPAQNYSVLVPNQKGYEAFVPHQDKVKEIAVFASASEVFSQKNINCSIVESIARFKPVIQQAQHDGIRVRAYVSCVVGCPYEGAISADKVSEVVASLTALNVDEISLGDTIGVGTPATIIPMLKSVQAVVSLDKIALHCHDTYGQALVNIYASLQEGVRIFDSSVAGLGGCPYAQGASGNVATEDVIYLMDRLGIETGVDLAKLAKVGNQISQALGRKTGSKVASALF